MLKDLESQATTPSSDGPASLELDTLSVHQSRLAPPKPASYQTSHSPTPRIQLTPSRPTGFELDDFPRGYPQYSALLSAEKPWQVFRRFTRMFMTLLLVKQNEIEKLEQQLDSINRNEEFPVRHALLRMDKNEERAAVYAKLLKGMKQYHALMTQCRDLGALQDAPKRSVRHLQALVKGKAYINTQDTAYLWAENDLACIHASRDGPFEMIEACLVDILDWIFGFGKKSRAFVQRFRRPRFTADGDVAIYSPTVTSASRAIVTALIYLVMLIPVIVLNVLSAMVGRLVVIAVAAGLFISILSFTHAKTIEMMAAGAAYTAVLVAFTSDNNGLRSDRYGQCVSA